MGVSPLHHLRASNEEIIDFCAAAIAASEAEPKAVSDGDGIGRVLSDPKYSGKIIKISTEAVVKAKWSMSLDEAANQAYAHYYATGPLRVPAVYRFFEDERESAPSCKYNYLVMEFIPGPTLAELDWQGQSSDDRRRITDQVTQALHALHAIPMPVASQPRPGPLGGGKPQGYLWSDNGSNVAFKSTSQLERWINRRIARRAPYLDDPSSYHDVELDLQHEVLVMCHMDLARRNIVCMPDGQLCLLDWAFAGFYPRGFELYTLFFCGPWDPEYYGPIRAALGTCGVEEERQVEWLGWAQCLAARGFANDPEWVMLQWLQAWLTVQGLSQGVCYLAVHR